MTPALHAHLEALGENGRAKVARDSREALAIHWPHRHVRTSRMVVQANVTMLRNLRAF